MDAVWLRGKIENLEWILLDPEKGVAPTLAAIKERLGHGDKAFDGLRTDVTGLVGGENPAVRKKDCTNCLSGRRKWVQWALTPALTVLALVIVEAVKSQFFGG